MKLLSHSEFNLQVLSRDHTPVTNRLGWAGLGWAGLALAEIGISATTEANITMEPCSPFLPPPPTHPAQVAKSNPCGDRVKGP